MRILVVLSMSGHLLMTVIARRPLRGVIWRLLTEHRRFSPVPAPSSRVRVRSNAAGQFEPGTWWLVPTLALRHASRVRRLSPILLLMNTSLCGNFSNSDAGLLKLVARTSVGLPAIHCDRSIVS